MFSLGLPACAAYSKGKKQYLDETVTLTNGLTGFHLSKKGLDQVSRPTAGGVMLSISVTGKWVLIYNVFTDVIK